MFQSRKGKASVFVWLIVVVGALVSSFLTFLGLLTRSESHLALLVALGVTVFSFLLLIGFSRKMDSIAMRSVKLGSGTIISSIIGYVICIFVASTFWSVVGFARDELFFLQAVELTNSLSGQVRAQMDTTSFMSNKYRGNIDLAIIFLREARQRAASGMYTGYAIRGSLWKNFNTAISNMESLQRKIESSREKENALVARINTMIASLRKFAYYEEKGTYIDLLMKSEQEVRELRLLHEDQSVDLILNLLSSIRGNIQNLVEKIDNEARINLLRTELDLIDFYLKQFKSLAGFQFPGIRVNPDSLDIPMWQLAFRHFLKILTWWVMCIAIDFAPIVIVIFNAKMI